MKVVRAVIPPTGGRPGIKPSQAPSTHEGSIDTSRNEALWSRSAGRRLPCFSFAFSETKEILGYAIFLRTHFSGALLFGEHVIFVWTQFLTCATRAHTRLHEITLDKNFPVHFLHESLDLNFPASLPRWCNDVGTLFLIAAGDDLRAVPVVDQVVREHPDSRLVSSPTHDQIGSARQHFIVAVGRTTLKGSSSWYMVGAPRFGAASEHIKNIGQGVAG